jgi:hypothetical protein
VSDHIWAIASQVPLDVYGTDQLDERLRDMDWVAQVAVRHERIVEHIAACAGVTVVPMKLFTLFSSDERAVAALRRNRRALSRVFARVQGCQEWGVRIFPQASETSLAGRPPVRPPTGTAFLTAKKQARERALERGRQAAEVALTSVAALSALAQSVTDREVPASAAFRPLVDTAFLVSTADRKRFLQAARRSALECRRGGASLQISGPWPPYSFVDMRKGARE